VHHFGFPSCKCSEDSAVNCGKRNNSYLGLIDFYMRASKLKVNRLEVKLVEYLCTSSFTMVSKKIKRTVFVIIKLACPNMSHSLNLKKSFDDLFEIDSAVRSCLFQHPRERKLV